MSFGTAIGVILSLYLIYYAVMIALEIFKPEAATANGASEEDIDISGMAKEFTTTKIEDKTSGKLKRPKLKHSQPQMAGGLTVNQLAQVANDLHKDRNSVIGKIFDMWEVVPFAA